MCGGGGGDQPLDEHLLIDRSSNYMRPTRPLHSDPCTVQTPAQCRPLHRPDPCTVQTPAQCRPLHSADPCTVQTSQLSLFGSVTHYFTSNLTTGIIILMYYFYGVSLPIQVQLLVHIYIVLMGISLPDRVISLQRNASLTIMVERSAAH